MLNEKIQSYFDNIYSSDKDAQNEAFYALMDITDTEVGWAYEVWDDLVQGLANKDNHVRAITSQLLCNLSRSDPDERLLVDFDALLNVTRDERFVTARHCLQALWKIGTVSKQYRDMLIIGLKVRYDECIDEKNTTLIRFDIIQNLRKIYDVLDEDEKADIKAEALAWIKLETATKYQKKYAQLWKTP